MGAWGGGLYSDDDALEIKDTISVMSKMPVDGERLLDLVLKNYDGATELEEEGGPTFWLVVADQFEKRGLFSKEALSNAMLAIEGGYDIADMESREMDSGAIRQRKKSYDALLSRLNNPRPVKPVRPKSQPRCNVSPGEIYTYPVMNGDSFNAWFSSWDQASFHPDGWGALLVLSVDRVFDWFPVITFSSFYIYEKEKPDLEVCLNSNIADFDYAARCHHKPTHMKRMGMELLGKLSLNEKANRFSNRFYQTEHFVINDISICSGAKAFKPKVGAGIKVRKVVSSA